MKKIVFRVLLLSLLFSGCGSSAPAECAADNVNQAYSATTGSITAPSGADGAWSAGGTNPRECPSCAGEGEDSVHYFVLNRSNHTVTAPDDAPILYEYRCRTEFTASDSELEAWVDSILTEIHVDYVTRSNNLADYASESMKEEENSGFYAFSNYQDIGIARHDDDFVSLIVLNSVYSGGVHPNSIQTAWNLDLQNRKVLTLEDILMPGTESFLADLVCGQVEECFAGFGSGALFEDYQQTIASSFTPGAMTPYWYFNDEGLVVFFNQYTLGPYASGIIKATLSYDSLNGVIRDEYVESVADAVSGKPVLQEDVEGRRQYPVTVEPESDIAFIGVEGEVTRLRLSEVSFLEDTAIGQKILFSANRLTDRDVIVLMGRFDRPDNVFALEYRSAEAETEVLYLKGNGLSRTP